MLSMLQAALSQNGEDGKFQSLIISSPSEQVGRSGVLFKKLYIALLVPSQVIRMRAARDISGIMGVILSLSAPYSHYLLSTLAGI